MVTTLFTNTKKVNLLCCDLCVILVVNITAWCVTLLVNTSFVASYKTHFWNRKLLEIVQLHIQHPSMLSYSDSKNNLKCREEAGQSNTQTLIIVPCCCNMCRMWCGAKEERDHWACYQCTVQKHLWWYEDALMHMAWITCTSVKAPLSAFPENLMSPGWKCCKLCICVQVIITDAFDMCADKKPDGSSPLWPSTVFHRLVNISPSSFLKHSASFACSFYTQT